MSKRCEDTIYRQDAIDAVFKEGHGTIKERLERLPSAQSDCTDCIKNGGDYECDRVHCHKGRGDVIDRQAAIALAKDICVPAKDGYVYKHRCIDPDEILRLPSVTPIPEPQWIPVKMRPMDSEEREYWEDQFGEELEDEDAVMFDCPMPEDGQEILVSYRKWISMDKCEIDGGCYGLEGNGDWEDVIAWMPSPEPYLAERREE